MTGTLTVSEKIDKAHKYHAHISVINKDGYIAVRELTERHMGVRWPTVKKYISIKERLHRDLLPYLDKKGKDKLSIGLAVKLTELVWNPNYQLEIFPVINRLPNAEAIKIGVWENTECILCCAPTSAMEQTPCCKNFYCFDCQKRTIETAINHLAFLGVKCPFCKTYFTKGFIQDWLNGGEYKDVLLTGGRDWRKDVRYKNMKLPSTIYMYNLWKKCESLFSSVENANNSVPKNDYPALFEGDLYYGPCTRCTPGVREFGYQRDEFGHMNVCSVEKQCANAEGDLAVLQADMFVCIVCKSFEEDYEDGTFKKCPHCGIKTLKPSGCNYVKCGDHRWCFICNERLPVSHDGHNTHYYTGPGTSAYSHECRQSLRTDTPKFILSSCNCESCFVRGGRQLCRELECMETAVFTEYCIACDNSWLLMSKYYERYNREPSLSDFYQKYS